eukprot:gene26150-31579_t
MIEISTTDAILAAGMAVLAAIISLFILVPMLLRLLPFKNLPIHQYVTSDIPGNPHVFDFSIISLLRTMPEPNNFNLVWTKVPLKEPLLMSGPLPPGRFSSASVYGGLGAVPESTELAEDPSNPGYFKLVVLRKSSDTPSNLPKITGKIHKLVIEDEKAEVGMVVMRNYLVPPGTLIYTPEIKTISNNAIVRHTQRLVAGAASVHLQQPYWFTSFTQLGALHLLGWGLLWLGQGLGVVGGEEGCVVHGVFSIVAAALTWLLYISLYIIGKRRMKALGEQMSPHPNKLTLCDLETSAKGSQPSKIHKYFFMRYSIPRDMELRVQSSIHTQQQVYWSCVAYDLYGVCYPQFVYDLNASKTWSSANVYDVDIRMVHKASSPFGGKVSRKGVTEMEVGWGTGWAAGKGGNQEGYVLFRLNHPTTAEATKFSQPIVTLVPRGYEDSSNAISVGGNDSGKNKKKA